MSPYYSIPIKEHEWRRRMENVECLMNFGLTRQEANLYVLLVLEGELNGYEAAKKSGISRYNTYNALAGLVEKGAAYMSEEDTVKYQAVPVEEFCDNKIRDLKKSKKELAAKLPKQRINKGAYLTIKGERQILDKFTNMLRETKERVYVSASNEKLNMFREYFTDLAGRGIKVVIITNEPFELKGAIIYLTEHKKEQIRLITDSTYVLTGDLVDRYNAACLYSSNHNLAEVFKDALANEIKLLEIKKGNQ